MLEFLNGRLAVVQFKVVFLEDYELGEPLNVHSLIIMGLRFTTAFALFISNRRSELHLDQHLSALALTEGAELLEYLIVAGHLFLRDLDRVWVDLCKR